MSLLLLWFLGCFFLRFGLRSSRRVGIGGFNGPSFAGSVEHSPLFQEPSAIRVCGFRLGFWDSGLPGLGFRVSAACCNDQVSTL